MNENHHNYSIMLQFGHVSFVLSLTILINPWLFEVVEAQNAKVPFRKFLLRP